MVDWEVSKLFGCVSISDTSNKVDDNIIDCITVLYHTYYSSSINNKSSVSKEFIQTFYVNQSLARFKPAKVFQRIHSNISEIRLDSASGEKDVKMTHLLKKHIFCS